MTSNAVTIKFAGAEIITSKIDDTEYVALKPICDHLGLKWERQRERIAKDPILSGVCQTLALTISSQEQSRTYTLMDVNYVQGWLFSLQVRSLKPELQEKLHAYKLECYQVLHDYWNKGYAINARVKLSARDKLLFIGEIERLIALLKIERDPAIRARHQYFLTNLSNDLGLPVPEIPAYSPQNDNATAWEFWCVVDELISSNRVKNYSDTAERIAIDMMEIYQTAANYCYELTKIGELSKALMETSYRQFVRKKKIDGVWCWIFRAD